MGPDISFGRAIPVEFYERLKSQLDQVHTWPSLYVFKFIVPAERQEELLPLLPIGQIEQKLSSSGKYVSVTLKAMISDSDQVIAVYQRAGQIEGIVSL
jgi:putative lipoic acid-binding regulatory protein